MNCFWHQDRPAVGVCTACGKGLCAECAVDLQRGTACKDKCEVEVRRLIDLRDFSLSQPNVQEKILKSSSRASYRAAIFQMVLGSIFVTWWLLDRRFTVLAILGALFLAFGLFSALTLRGRIRSDQFRLCQQCGYNITGNTTGRCPECGRAIGSPR
jgi:hypothetical protein